MRRVRRRDATNGTCGRFRIPAQSTRPARGGETAQYHGVEHKAIAAYELGGDPTDEDVVMAAAKEHERCGSHLVAPMMIAATLPRPANRKV